MRDRRVLFILCAIALLITGCKPAPKHSRAKPDTPPAAAPQTQQPSANQPQPPAPRQVVSSAAPDSNQSLTGTSAHPSPVAAVQDPNKAPLSAKPLPPGASDPNSADPNHATPSDAVGEPNEVQNSFNLRFDTILAIYVDAKGKVDYSRLRRMRLVFTPLLQQLSTLDAKEYDAWPKTEKIAFWINTYNVCTLKVVADNYPIKASVYKTLFYPAGSIMQIDQPWTGYKFNIMGVEYDLSEIEQRILLNQFSEERVAFALSYAAGWSPRLRNEPYYGVRLDKQLDQQVREYISSEKGFRIDKDSSTVYLSILFTATRFPPGFVEKYGADRRFNDERPEIRAMLGFIGTYLSRTDTDYLSGKKYTVSYMKPDWALND
jgi:hypothetical protein